MFWVLVFPPVAAWRATHSVGETMLNGLLLCAGVLPATAHAYYLHHRRSR